MAAARPMSLLAPVIAGLSFTHGREAREEEPILEKQTPTMNPELVTAGKWAKRLILPSIRFFKFSNWLAKFAPPPAIKGYTQSTVHIPRSEAQGELRALLYRPEGAAEPLPGLLYIHGGGYAIGSPESSGAAIKAFAKAHSCVIIAPAYRKSMEAPYPAALDDCYDALLWMVKNAAELGIRSDQIMVGGHSAGGGLTAALSLRARNRDSVRIAFQMPVYPMIDDRMVNPSARDNHAPVWNSAHNELGWSLYLKGLKRRGEAPRRGGSPCADRRLERPPPHRHLRRRPRALL